MIKILVNNFASIYHLFQFHSIFSLLIGLFDSNYYFCKDLQLLYHNLTFSYQKP